MNKKDLYKWAVKNGVLDNYLNELQSEYLLEEFGLEHIDNVCKRIKNLKKNLEELVSLYDNISEIQEKISTLESSITLDDYYCLKTRLYLTLLEKSLTE